MVFAVSPYIDPANFRLDTAINVDTFTNHFNYASITLPDNFHLATNHDNGSGRWIGVLRLG